MGRMILSICAVVVALGLGASAQKGPERQEPAQKGQTASDQRPQIAPVSPSVSESQGEAGENQGEAPRQPSGIAERDLKAQQAMAFIAAVQLFLTGVGIWYIRKTLVETENAIVEAGKATAAAQDAIKHQKQVADLDSRPWLSVKVTAAKEELTITSNPVRFLMPLRVAVHNHGKLPASYQIVFCPVKEPLIDLSEFEELAQERQVFPYKFFREISFPGTQSAGDDTNVTIPPEARDSIQWPDGSYLLKGGVVVAVLYTDNGGGEMYETSQVISWTVNGLAGDEGLTDAYDRPVKVGKFPGNPRVT